MPDSLTVDDPRNMFNEDFYAAHGYPYEAWAKLRRNEPVYRHEDDAHEPFWALTRHADVMAVGRDSKHFINAKGITVLKRQQLAAGVQGVGFPMLLEMDPPKHGKYRMVVRDRFIPSAMRALEQHIVERCREISAEVVTNRIVGLAGQGPVDFVTEVAAKLPLDVILEMLGVPGSDRDQMFIWSNAVIGSADPEYGDKGAPIAVVEKARNEIFAYFARHVADRRARPGSDLVSLLVDARIDGEPLNDMEILGFCFILALAGNETTRNATSGAMLALMENPLALVQLQTRPDLMVSGVEELLRWVAPIIYMARTATRDTEIGGKLIRAGEKVALFYPAANRDESVFSNPDVIDLERSPNNHVTFGFGRHICLGNELARIELRAILGEILSRFPNITQAGPVERLRSNFVGGIKHLPVDFGEPAVG